MDKHEAPHGANSTEFQNKSQMTYLKFLSSFGA